jgi:hypothetical protein
MRQVVTCSGQRLNESRAIDMPVAWKRLTVW